MVPKTAAAPNDSIKLGEAVEHEVGDEGFHRTLSPSASFFLCNVHTYLRDNILFTEYYYMSTTLSTLMPVSLTTQNRSKIPTAVYTSIFVFPSVSIPSSTSILLK